MTRESRHLPAQPYDGIVDLHRRLGHEVRASSDGARTLCVRCSLLWTTQRGGWYSTDLLALRAA